VATMSVVDRLLVDEMLLPSLPTIAVLVSLAPPTVASLACAASLCEGAVLSGECDAAHASTGTVTADVIWTPDCPSHLCSMQFQTSVWAVML
jgi:hypothetical protein